MGTFTPKLNLYKPAIAERGWGEEVDTNWDIIESVIAGVVSVKDPQWGAVGDGVADDTEAIRAAIEYIQTVRWSGSLYFPPGQYKITETIDLSSAGVVHNRLHVLGAHNSSGYLSGENPPAVYIDGSSITDGPTFYCDTGGIPAYHTWDNIMVQGGRTAWHYREASDVRFNNCGGSCIDDSSDDNCAVLMENCFWFWFNDGGYTSATADRGALILRSVSPVINPGGYLIDMRRLVFYGGGMDVQNRVEGVTAGYELTFVNCASEASSGGPMLRYGETGLATPINIVRVEMRQCAMYDSLADVPLIIVDGPLTRMFNTVISQAVGSGEVAIRAFSGGVYNTKIEGTVGTGTLYKVVDGSGDLLGGIWDKEQGTDYRGTETDATTTNLLLSTGPLLRFARSGDAYARSGISSDGVVYWGPGGATATGWDTQLSRLAPNVVSLGANDALRVGFAVHGSLPAAGGYTAGSQFYCSSDKQPLWSDGSGWFEADGTAH